MFCFCWQCYIDHKLMIPKDICAALYTQIVSNFLDLSLIFSLCLREKLDQKENQGVNWVLSIYFMHRPIPIQLSAFEGTLREGIKTENHYVITHPIQKNLQDHYDITCEFERFSLLCGQPAGKPNLWSGGSNQFSLQENIIIQFVKLVVLSSRIFLYPFWQQVHCLATDLYLDCVDRAISD